MQIQKEEIRIRLIKIARKEFIAQGYKGASMRAIAKKAGVGLSNIYNYFSNKDMLLEEILEPVILELNKSLDNHNCDANVSLDIFASEEYLKEHTDWLVDLVTRYRDELYILLLGANGSSLENFKDNYIERHTQIGVEYLRKMKLKHPKININISRFFIHNMSSWWMATLSELVMHDLSFSKLEQFISEYMSYSTAGWKKLMKVR